MSEDSFPQMNAAESALSSLNACEKLERLLDAVVKALEAERGFIMLYVHSIRQFDVYATRNFDSELIFTTDEHIFASEGISLTILDRVIREGKPVQSTDAADDPRFKDKSSIIITKLRSFICVPISLEKGLILGVLYIDNRKRRRIFSPEQAQYLTACAQKLSKVITKLFPEVKPVPLEEILHHRCLELRKSFPKRR